MINLRIHPQKIIQGYRLARDTAVEALKGLAMDNSAEEDKFKADLFNIAMTTLSSKLLH